ncbi:MAG: adaptor protein MecA [Lachnospiraceae bacterium]|nr:adaptor protein MecA [Lachnospiraceae bacterium]
MKLEKMNEQQIRCTLTSEDLKERRIKLSELAYGSEKARSLFKDMMIQAAGELDFEVNDEPLMIEAVPINSETMVLTVTKVEDPDELDTRFARFAPDILEDRMYEDEDVSSFVPDEDLQSWLQGLSEKTLGDSKVPAPEKTDLRRLFSADSIDECIRLARIISPEYSGENTLYRDGRTGRYLLLIAQSDMELIDFNRICNIISEYCESEKNLLATAAYLNEHCETIIAENAVEKLALI